ncbi:molybdenum cofactor guanylyltransferase [Virgibacillus subterraneus]|uniref:Probable molybdenum cofactor guanylyltransferase n=2 Tax=Virgibacillus TaxID=84406 RepID=A0A1H1BV52_9BACI|nr:MULTISPECIES: molybdenum cofactor guanylyltransferase [Virgibacillus]SDQ55781.1 molybdenum cofactor guanylyltransferase [Virgibacillus salinus]SEQ27731.1 molybdenum cofactor guanylyltransferase [Virgibacillus subterraneus]
MNISGVVLSGGKSSRMGTNKSLLTLEGKPVIEHITNELQLVSHNVSVISNTPSSFDFLNLDLYGDRYLNSGPLAGLESAMYNINADIYIFAACDMPFVHKDVFNYLLQSLGEFDAVVPIYKEKMHPLSGVYTSNILPEIQQQLAKNQLKVRELFNHINVNYVKNFKHISNQVVTRHFFNMNYPDQYKEAKLFSS